MTLYENMSVDDLEREYSPSSMIDGDASRYLTLYSELSAKARQSPVFNADLAYGTRRGQVLDFFRSGRPEPSPLHIFIHGGYWQELNHKQSAFMVPWLTDRGIAHAVVNYTLAPHATIEQMVAECRNAIQWLIDRHELLGVDPTKVTVSGHSAGAHLLAMVLTTPGSDESEMVLPIRAALMISGIFDIRPIRNTYINEPLQLSEFNALAWSPLFRKIVSPCPTHIAIGRHETPEFHRQSEAYRAHLEKQGIQTSLAIYEGHNHFDLPLALDKIEAQARHSGINIF